MSFSDPAEDDLMGNSSRYARGLKEGLRSMIMVIKANTPMTIGFMPGLHLFLDAGVDILKYSTRS